MSNLIKALQIFLKYADPDYPFHCEHDTLDVYGINPTDVSADDIGTLDGLGFFVSDEHGELHFRSYRYGSC